MRLGIIGAMDVEVAQLRDHMTDVEVVRAAGVDLWVGTLAGAPVVVAQSGVGKVNAALCVQAMVDRTGVTHLLNTGVAGALDPRLDVGDIVVSRDCVYHDVDVTLFGYAPGQLPGTPAREFVADPGLVARVLASVAEVAPEVHAYEGRVVSGDQFVSDPAVRERLVGEFAGTCCEMEGTAIAQAAAANGIPFVIVRAISDKVGSTTPVEYSVFEAEAARHCAGIVEALLAGSPHIANSD